MSDFHLVVLVGLAEICLFHIVQLAIHHSATESHDGDSLMSPYEREQLEIPAPKAHVNPRNEGKIPLQTVRGLEK